MGYDSKATNTNRSQHSQEYKNHARTFLCLVNLTSKYMGFQDSW